MNARAIGLEAPLDSDTASQLAHELRSSLNGIKTWVTVLQGSLEAPGPLAVRAMEGVLEGVDQQVRLIEALERLGNAAGKE